MAVELLLAAARAMAPVIRRFISLGLNRVWLHAGETVYQCVRAAAGALLWGVVQRRCLLRVLLSGAGGLAAHVHCIARMRRGHDPQGCSCVCLG